ncbi:MAG TPA: TonB family protein [Arenimonas sp.]|nr:TonB family protein [Arenimonas sp.]
MKKILASCLASALLALSAGASAVPQQADDSNFNLSFVLELDRDGQIVSLQPQPAMDSPALIARIESEVRDWEFRPAQLDGQPVPTRTYLRLGVRAPGLQADKARIVSATTGPAIASMTAPGYPPAALRRGEGGLVLLKLKLDTQGRVRGVAAQPGSSSNRAFTEAASAAARNWRFLPELANGKPVAGAVLIPVCFRAESAEPQACDWQGPSGQRFTPSSVAVAIEPAARITTDLAIASN